VIAKAWCDHTFKCCIKSEDLDEWLGIEPKAQCYEFDGLIAAVVALGIHNDAAKGKIALGGAALKSCADAYVAASCKAFAKNTAPLFDCPAGLKGLLIDGTVCDSDFVCMSSHCESKCAPLPGAGAPCTYACASGLFCDSGTGTCTAQKAVGAPCVADDECAGGGQCFDPMHNGGRGSASSSATEREAASAAVGSARLRRRASLIRAHAPSLRDPPRLPKRRAFHNEP